MHTKRIDACAMKLLPHAQHQLHYATQAQCIYYSYLYDVYITNWAVLATLNCGTKSIVYNFILRLIHNLYFVKPRYRLILSRNKQLHIQESNYIGIIEYAQALILFPV